MSLKHNLLACARLLGLFRMARWLTRGRPRILAYHGIWLGDGHFGNHLFMSPQRFCRRLELLAQWGYPVVSLEDAVSASTPIPPAATVITIDDGWVGTYRHMVPALARHGYPATVYLATYYSQKQRPVVDVALQYLFSGECDLPPHIDIPGATAGSVPLGTPQQRAEAQSRVEALMAALPDDDQRQALLESLVREAGLDWSRVWKDRWFHLMSAEEVADAASRGICFELHTHRHRVVSAGHSCLSREIADNRAVIVAETGREPRHFCYPSGIYDRSMWSELESAGVASATTTAMGLYRRGDNRYEIPRIMDGEAVSELEFEAEMSGVLELLRLLRRSLPIGAGVSGSGVEAERASSP
ncbi:polysaccharide deacetylase family protein [Parahaliea mediterranea]|uniref:Polysaccharide deacetylase family protein n=1 Tax=Parahaliea mediterranea TaxID=651086 RepID=A0A939IKK9_9GAMM|nr:polysaccharide deacetylase family protein [Parahaliea mediterranea]MBN7797431.1 polysaccharide deacetylase family protein [Parahaliea mediterranea]